MYIFSVFFRLYICIILILRELAIVQLFAALFGYLFLLHGLESYHYLPEGVIFPASDADVVGGECAAGLIYQHDLGCFEERRRLPQGSVILFSLDVEESGPVGGIAAHADGEAKPVVVHLRWLKVEVGVASCQRGGDLVEGKSRSRQMTSGPYEPCRTVTQRRGGKTAASVATPAGGRLQGLLLGVDNGEKEQHGEGGDAHGNNFIIGR